MKRAAWLVSICLFLVVGGSLGANAQSATDTATGVVFEDLNNNGEQDGGERGVPRVPVSNGRDVVRSDAKGRYKLEVTDETIIFITKPSGYMVPVSDDQLPQFYYLHFPNGSPVDTHFPGVQPTGPLPDSVDFPLIKSKERSNFKAVVFADPQTRNFGELEDFRTDVVDELIGTDASFGLTVGDIVNDPLDLFEPHNEIVATIGIPWWNLPGNHDMNLDVPDDTHATETYKRVYGPTNYSADYGEVHFVNMDNVDYLGEATGDTRGFFNEQQLDWLANDLEFVADDKLVVIATHIPLRTEAIGATALNTVNLDELFEVLEGREHLFSISGHDTSNSWQMYLEPGEVRTPPPGVNPAVWNGDKTFHHQVLAEVRGGGWTTGPLDERGVPAAEMADGNPNGYYFLTFKGNSYSTTFKPASLPAGYQMRITFRGGEGNHVLSNGEPVWIPSGPSGVDGISPAPVFRPADWTGSDGRQPKVEVNVFDGGRKHRVEISFDRREFVRMDNNPPVFGLTDGDPNGNLDTYIRALRESLVGSERPVNPEPSSHIWTTAVPSDLGPGLHKVTIRSKDPFGKVSQRTQTFRIVPDSGN